MEKRDSRANIISQLCHCAILASYLCHARGYAAGSRIFQEFQAETKTKELIFDKMRQDRYLCDYHSHIPMTECNETSEASSEFNFFTARKTWFRMFLNSFLIILYSRPVLRLGGCKCAHESPWIPMNHELTNKYECTDVLCMRGALMKISS